MIFSANSYIIPHGNLTPDQGLILFFGLLLFGLVAYGLYVTFGEGSKNLRDQIDEHAKMHELGIAHGHSGNSKSWKIAKGEDDYPKHKHED